MDYVLLTPEEAATLLNFEPGEIVGLIETGELGGLKVAGQWRVPLKSITQLLADGVKLKTARSLAQVFEDHATWRRVFGAHPEVTQQLEAGQFPPGSVGARLKEAIALARTQARGPGAGENEDPALQDADNAPDAEQRQA